MAVRDGDAYNYTLVVPIHKFTGAPQADLASVWSQNKLRVRQDASLAPQLEHVVPGLGWIIPLQHPVKIFSLVTHKNQSVEETIWLVLRTGTCSN